MKFGALILNFMACLWAEAALIFASAPDALKAVPVAISLLSLWFCLRAISLLPPRSEQDQRRIGRVVSYASAAEGVGLFLAVNILNNLDMRDAVVPCFAIIVGLHFLPMAAKMPVPAYYVTGGLLILAGLGGLLLPMPDRWPLVCAAAAIILWGSSMAIFGRAARLQAAG